MNFIQGENREQFQLMSLEAIISQDNTVLFVDAFVEKRELEKLGFNVVQLQLEGFTKSKWRMELDYDSV